MEKCLNNARPTTSRACYVLPPTASRACCYVLNRLARRAGVDVRVSYRVARLLLRILPPRQARGARLPCHDEHTRSRAQSRPLRLQMRTRRFQRNPPPVVVSRKTSGASLPKKQVRRKRAEAFSQDLDFFPPHNLRRPGSDGGLLVEGLPTGFDWSTRSPDQRGFPDLWNRVSQAPGFCSPRALDRPGSDRGTIPKGTRHARRARRSRTLPPRQARARVARVLHRLAKRAGLHVRAPCRVALAVACSTASPGTWASTLTRVLPRRALAVACSTALPCARASTFARPTAPRAYCRVFYRLARRAGVDVRVSYRVARLLLRILPPRQARGARLPCHDVKNTRARARRAAPSDCRCGQEGSRGTPPPS